MFLGVLLCATIGFAALTDYEVARVAGSSTTASGAALLICDSTDTFQVDTFMSDTVSVLEDAVVNIGIESIDVTEADSANDSVVIIVQTLTAFTGASAHVIYTDTFINHNAATDDSVLYHHFKSDTLLWNDLYFRTIVKDSFILGEGIDTTQVRVRMHVVQRQVD